MPDRHTFKPSLAGDYRPDANNFNLIRLVLAAAVICSHSYSIATGLHGEDSEPLHRWTRGHSDIGAVAVDGFFALSGFLLSSSWGRNRGLADFARRRMLRIYPGFLTCIFVCIAVVGPLSVSDAKAYFWNPRTYGLLHYLYFGKFVNGLPGAFPHNPIPEIIDSSLWTIKYEVYCYGALAAWAFAGLLRPLPTLVMLACLMAFYATADRMGLSLRFALAPGYLPRLATFFFGGVALYLWRQRIPTRAWQFAVAATLLISALKWNMWATLVLPTAGLYCLFYLGTRRQRVTNRVGRRNDLSYGIYLYAWPVQQLSVQYLVGAGRPWRVTIVTLPIVAVVATISWVVVERPALRLKWKHFFPGRASAVAEVSPAIPG